MTPLRTAGLAVLGLLAAVLHPASAVAAATTRTFEFTGGSQSFTVPADVCRLSVDALGGQGGTSEPDSVSGGLGGRAVATIAVTPGETLQVYVGGKGGGGGLSEGPVAGGAGGFNGGGNGGRATASGGGGGGAPPMFAVVALRWQAGCWWPEEAAARVETASATPEARAAVSPAGREKTG